MGGEKESRYERGRRFGEVGEKRRRKWGDEGGRKMEVAKGTARQER